jgi:magnesium chelatase family protein
MLARRLPGILPAPTLEEALETTAIHSVAGLLGGRPLLARRPFRAPHHTTSAAALVGGGRPLRPGEVTLAHRGVLFLDELAEFSRSAPSSRLRQPLEERVVHVSRAAASESFPADALVVAAMNPCPCGYAGEPSRACSCPPGAAERYRRRISGPLLDRFDVHVEVPSVRLRRPRRVRVAERSSAIAARVRCARRRQSERFGHGSALNAHMAAAEIARYCPLDAAASDLLARAASRLALSARGCGRVLKVARTIADLAERDGIGAAPPRRGSPVPAERLELSVVAIFATSTAALASTSPEVARRPGGSIDRSPDLG